MISKFKSILRVCGVGLGLYLLPIMQLFLSKDDQKTLRSWWYNKIYDGRELTLGEIKYVLHQQDVVSQVIFTDHIFDGDVFETLTLLSPLCNAYIDIGANIGAMAIRIGTNTSLPLYCVEPVSSNYDLLVKNISLNGLDNRSTRLKVALGAQEGAVPIYLSAKNRGDHRLTVAASENRDAEYVDMITTDILCKKYVTEDPPYLIKMDVQGYEPFVLQGFQSLLHNPCIIITEVWAYGLVTAQSSVMEFEKLCHSFRLKSYHLPAPEDTDWRVIENMSKLFDTEDSYQHTDILLTNMELPTLKHLREKSHSG